MKVPLDDRRINPRSSSTRDWKDVICDKCGNSCRDSENMNFEFAEITAHWGYMSKKDCEKHTAQVCEKCYDVLGIKPEIAYYM